MRKVLLLDIESTGLDAKADRIIELGMMVTSSDFKVIHEEYNKLVWDDTYPTLTPEIEELTGITQEELLGNSIKPWLAMQDFNELIFKHEPEFIIAYNSEFDRSFIDEELKRNNHDVMANWLCAMQDIDTNKKSKSWKLMHLALDYGVPVDPNELHRAINDVELMRKVLVASSAKPSDMFTYRMAPSVYIRAVVEAPWKDNGAGIAKAKSLGFSWEKVRGDTRMFEKCWVKLLKETELTERNNYPFETKILGVKDGNKTNSR